jgi:hypothetical protein
VTDEAPRSVVLDAGPIIGVLFEGDAFHQIAADGLRRLSVARTEIVVPVPIAFEVYKRLAYDVSPTVARLALSYMHDGFTLVYFGPGDLLQLQGLVESMPWWGGSLEDALVALVALDRRAPVWTFNYRDLGAFPNLSFWTPG